MAKILVLEDQEDSFYLLKSAIGNLHDLIWADSVAQAMSLYNKTIELALVDICLADGDGFQFCDWVRLKQQDNLMPILFLSANTSVESRITGFSVGGDDYICKPFNFIELKMRIEAKLKWLRSRTLQNQKLMVSEICIDQRSQRASVLIEDKMKDLDLTPIEFKILNLFLSEPDKVFSRDELLNKIWGDSVFVFPRSVDTHVSKLRSKMGKKSVHFRSVHGVGYKFVSDVTPLERGLNKPNPF